MHKELRDRNDRDLLQIYTADPHSVEGLGADAELRYRQYLAAKKYNRGLFYLTIVLAVWGAIQSASLGIEASAAWQSKNLSAKQANLAVTNCSPDAPSGSPEAAQLRELEGRVERLEKLLKDPGAASGSVSPKGIGPPSRHHE
jgi:hypothetical protein